MEDTFFHIFKNIQFAYFQINLLYLGHGAIKNSLPVVQQIRKT